MATIKRYKFLKKLILLFLVTSFFFIIKLNIFHARKRSSKDVVVQDAERNNVKKGKFISLRNIAYL